MKQKTKPSGSVGDAVSRAMGAVPPGPIDGELPPDGIEFGLPDPRSRPGSGPVVDGIEFNPDAAAEFSVKGDPAVRVPSRPVLYRQFHVWGKGRYLGKVLRAVDETDAIAQMVAAYKVKAPEQFMFRAEVVEGAPSVKVEPEQFLEMHQHAD